MSECPNYGQDYEVVLPLSSGKRSYKNFNFKEKNKYNIITKRRRLFCDKRKTIVEKKQQNCNSNVIYSEDSPESICNILTVPKLDPCDPIQAHRMQQRKRMIEKGKNTVGYDEYIRRVSKSQRKPRSLKYPTTPDHTDDIPNKRWLGLVRVWRKSLHQFDPPEMLQTHANSACTINPNSVHSNEPVQKCELSDTLNKSFLIELRVTDKNTSNPLSDRIKITSLQNGSGNEVELFKSITTSESDNNAVEKFNVWESSSLNRKTNLEEFPIDYDDDSDYELL